MSAFWCPTCHKGLALHFQPLAPVCVVCETPLQPAPHGLDTYGNPYPFAVDAALLDDPELNDRSDADDGVSFSLISDEDQTHILWVGHPDPAHQRPFVGRYLVQSAQGDGEADFRTGDVHLAVAELKRRGGAR